MELKPKPQNTLFTEYALLPRPISYLKLNFNCNGDNPDFIAKHSLLPSISCNHKHQSFCAV
eukprot:2693693-Amphidinium_carterae.1